MPELEALTQSWNWKGALATWLIVVAAISVGGFFLTAISGAASRRSFGAGLELAVDRVIGFLADLRALSLRRILAAAWLNVMESFRGKVLLVFVVFALLFLFAPWYLPGRSFDQVKVHVSFLYLTTALIVIVVAGVLAATSLPKDIKDQTIHTVVTKPVRRLELLIGRILGLTVGATLMLAVMGTVSYVYLTRSVSNSLEQLEDELAAARRAKNERHAAEIEEAIKQIRSRMVARVPITGKLSMKGINVGHEYTYRKFIGGNRPETAKWGFSGLPVQRLVSDKTLTVELTFWVFRTQKGEVGQGVLAQLTYRNPVTHREIADYPFPVREYYVNRQTLDNSPEKIRNYTVNGQSTGAIPENPVAWLLEGSDGSLEIEARCMSSAQFLGMAEPDLYVLLDNANFGVNFAKGLLGVWLPVFLIICVAVMFSTFLSAPVAILATVGVFAAGMSMDFLQKVATAEMGGGVAVTSTIKLLTHDSLESPLELGRWNWVVNGIDEASRYMLRGLTYTLPDLASFNTAPLVANGFDIPMRLLLKIIVVAFAYAIPFTIVGYFLFQSREIAR